MYSRYFDRQPIMMVGLRSYDKEVTLKMFDGGDFTVKLEGGKVVKNNDDEQYDGIYLKDHDDDENYYVEVPDMEIGIGFHWSRKENQRFKGGFMFRCVDGKILLVNYIPIELYLQSVISSEMNANCPKELLKAHAVISRSWALNRMDNIPSYQTPRISDYEISTWYDNGTHKYFDVCADDHCQRYQGVTRAINPNVKAAIEETFGEVLVYDERICDTRFSKCCGGASELFENCWQDKHYDYLEKVDDFDENFTDDLTVEENAVKFIKSSPKAYCNTSDKQLLSKILNSYDNEYSGFYRWTVFYTFDELSEIVKEKSGDDYGKIIDLIPLTRGVSGRIVRLKIVGEKKTRIVGKELEIRRLLSKSHLYSSAFTVEKNEKGFTLYGAGWGHGVGLCQIGAAVMAENGKNYKEILAHYYKGAKIEKLYDKQK